MFLRGIVTQAQKRGPRTYQEDYLVHIPFVNKYNERGHVLGVMDGHGGYQVAKFAAESMPRLFNPSADNREEELKKIVQQLDDRTAQADMGSTLSLAWINETRRVVTTAVLGDSPIIVVDEYSRTYLSEEHNVRTNQTERAAAECRGGVYSDGYIFNTPNNVWGLSHSEGLQLSRALGDRVLRNVLDRTPAISEHRLGRNSIVVVGSDGLFDPSHEDAGPDFAERLLAETHKGTVASDLLAWREKQVLNDNTSVIVWRPRRWLELFA